MDDSHRHELCRDIEALAEEMFAKGIINGFKQFPEEFTVECYPARGRLTLQVTEMFDGQLAYTMTNGVMEFSVAAVDNGLRWFTSGVRRTLGIGQAVARK